MNTWLFILVLVKLVEYAFLVLGILCAILFVGWTSLRLKLKRR